MTLTAVEKLVHMLDLERLEDNLFRGISPISGWQRVFGGQVISQALAAAQYTVDDARPVHSLHGYFLLAGDPGAPIVYDVERIRDGRSFTTRRVVAIQHGRAIFSMSASFQIVENGLQHQSAMPGVPMPEDLPPESELKKQFVDKAPEPVRRYWERERPIEIRPVDLSHYLALQPCEPVRHVWMRTSGKVGEGAALHACILAYASDMLLLDTSLLAHGKSVFDRDLQVASLDHAMWFHGSLRADEWLLYSQDSPASGGARSFNRGSVFTRDGRLVASVAQEGLIRPRTEPDRA